MGLKEALIVEFDAEMARTRKVLERTPEDKFGWKPHEKSGTLGWLATHVATLPNWAVMTVSTASFDVAPAGAEPMRVVPVATKAELLDKFERGLASAREAIDGCDESYLAQQWTLLATGQVLFTMPRSAVLRQFVMNHLIHHRAQLALYLRLNDVPVPALYGPSADEPA
jgi:uncharacterized damage-inducible protein DinB